LLAQSLKRVPIEASLAPVLTLTGGLAVFGLAQLLGTSGFLATYLAAVVTGATQHRARQDLDHFFEGMAWLAQIVLFLMLGLLVTPEDLPPYLPGAVIGTAVLILLARPLAVLVCLVPFGSACARQPSPPGWGCAGRCRSISASSPDWPIRSATSGCLPASSSW